MMENLPWIGGLCSAESLLRGGLLLGLFVAGAAGSVVHCGPMCGVFVLGQMSERMTRLRPERMCERQRIGNGLLLPYHLGRLTTYAVLGAVAASFGQVAAFGRFPAALLTLAAGLFLAQALGVGFDRAPRFWARLMGGATRRIPRGSLSGEFLLGLALGFLPCGLLYAAIVAAAASGRALMGAAAMLAFGAGTMPILMLIGIAGHAAGRRWNDGVRAAAPVLMVLNALLLLGLAWQRVT